MLNVSGNHGNRRQALGLCSQGKGADMTIAKLAAATLAFTIICLVLCFLIIGWDIATRKPTPRYRLECDKPEKGPQP